MGLQHKRGPSLSPNEISEWSNLGFFFEKRVKKKLCPIWCVCFNDCFTRRHFPVVFFRGKKRKNLPNDLVWKEIWKMTELLKITKLNVRKKIVSNAWTEIYTYTRLFCAQIKGGGQIVEHYLLNDSIHTIKDMLPLGINIYFLDIALWEGLFSEDV